MQDADYISCRIKTELFPCLLPDAFRRSAKLKLLPRVSAFANRLHVKFGIKLYVTPMTSCVSTEY